MRRRRRSEIAVAILVLSTAALVLWGYFWLTGRPLGHKGYTLVARVSNAEGLQRGDRVRLAGVEVGNVRRIRLDRSAVWVELRIDAGVNLPRDSRADLRSDGVFGVRRIELIPGTAPTPLRSGDTLAAASAPSLSETLETVGERVNEVLSSATAVLSPASVEALQRGIVSFGRALDELAALNASLRKTAEAFGRGFNEARLEGTAAGFEATARNLAIASSDLRASAGSLASILAKIDAGEGSLGRAVNDPALYEALLAATESVGVAAEDASSLVRDIQARPSRYVKIGLF